MSPYRELVEAMPDGVILFDITGPRDEDPIHIKSINRAACRMDSTTADEVIGRDVTQSLRHVDALAILRRIWANGGSEQATVEVPSRSRQLVWRDCRFVKLAGGLVAAIYRDITERRDALEKVAQANHQLYDIVESLPDATFVLDSERRIVAWNRAMERITGISKRTALGRTDIHSEIFYQGKGCLVDLLAEGTDPLPERYQNIKRNGSVVSAEVFAPKLFGGLGAHVAITAAVLRDENGVAYGAIETVRDITERRDLEERLAYAGTHDSLTGLRSRAFFEMALNSLDRDAFAEKGVIMCDLDGLKLVNDTLGHLAGDMMLRAAALVLRGSLRESDIVARIGGDEFAVILPACTADAAQAVCRRIQENLADYNADHPALPISISLGFATGIATPGIDLYRMADDAMYREKLHRTNSARSAIVRALMTTLAARDIVTEQHSSRIESLCATLAEALGLPESVISELRLLARFHDIGKISVADSILLKPGPLSEDEIDEMRQHCRIGYQIALTTPDLMPIAEWILCHHERWDGAGYPAGLKGEQIPLECRIVALVDAYDAMTHDRPYRKAMSRRAAVAELKRCAGTQFDPQLVRVLIGLLPHARSARAASGGGEQAAE